jgi:hypothetical protein
MKTMQQEIEHLLRAAPSPAPPAGLKEKLIREVRLPEVRPVRSVTTGPIGSADWLRRWWPVLAPAAVSVACAIGLTVQQAEIRSLKQTVENLSREAAANTSAAVAPGVPKTELPASSSATATEQEIARLKELAARLAEEVRQLERMRGENANLRNQLAAPPPGLLTPEETEALAQAKARAECIACVNNLKQFGLAVRTWAIDNADMSPPDVICMSNELSTPKVLVCPADKGRQAAKDWNTFTSSHCSYEYLAPSAPDTEPFRVLSRCPIHGNIGLCDGSVQRELGKRHPERLVQRSGKLYLADPAEQIPPANTPQGGSNP